MGELVPAYPQPYRLYNPLSGHPLYSGPNGQPGYGSPQPQADSWVQPDGVRVWFYDTSTPDATNRVALGLDVIWPGAPSIGYAGAYAAAQRHGANADQADLFAAISMAESSATWGDHNNNSRTGDDSIGLWQINLRAHPQYRAVNLYNIDANAQAAAEVSNNWTNPHPWSTYGSGAYKTYLHGSTAPVGQIIEAPPPAPPTAGPVRQAVDGIISSLPDPSIFGFHPRDLIGDALDPLANTIDAALSLILAGLAPVRKWVDDAADNVIALASPLVDAVEGELKAALNYGVGLVEGLARDAESFATTALHDAEQLATEALPALARFTEGLIVDAEHLAEAGIQEAETLASQGLRALIGETESLIVDAEHLAEAGVAEAEHLAEQGLRDVEGLIGTAVGDAESLAHELVTEAEHLADDALQAFIRDVFDPLDNLARHWFDDVLGGAEALFGDLVKLGDWVVAAASVAILGPLDVYDTVRDISEDDVIGAVRSSAGL